MFGRLHPLLLHLPVGLVVGLALFEGLACLRRAEAAPRFFVVLAALSAALAAGSGWVLHEEPGYGGRTLEIHEWLGLTTAGAALAAAGMRLAGRRRGYRWLLLLALAALLPASHFGATMTHGPGFVLEPLRRARKAASDEPAARREPSGAQQDESASPSEVTSPSDPEVAAESAPRATYAEHVAPLLANYCGACHGEAKQKADLRLDSPEHIVAGAGDGPVLAPGDVEGSVLVQRLRLPLDDPDHMPPDNKPQPSPEDVRLLVAWVVAGAPFEAPFDVAAAEGGASHEEERAAEHVADEALAPEPEPEAAPELASEAALAALRERLVHVQRTSQDAPELWIDFSAAAATLDGAAIVALLEPLRAQVAELSLARTAITDAALAELARMPRLRRLDLSDTPVSDAGLAALAGHRALVELVLVSTRLGEASVDTLLALPALERVWLWSSGLGTAGIARLRTERPALVVDAGDEAGAAALETEGELAFGGEAPPAASDAPPSAASAVELRPQNASCPVSGSPVDPRYAVVFEGRVLGFCCPNCPARFWADPETYRAALR